MDVRTTITDDQTSVVLTGNATVDNIATCSVHLRKIALGRGKLVAFDFSGVTEADESFFQCLISFSNYLVLHDSRMGISPLNPEHPVSLAAQDLGIDLRHFATVLP